MTGDPNFIEKAAEEFARAVSAGDGAARDERLQRRGRTQGS